MLEPITGKVDIIYDGVADSMRVYEKGLYYNTILEENPTGRSWWEVPSQVSYYDFTNQTTTITDGLNKVLPESLKAMDHNKPFLYEYLKYGSDYRWMIHTVEDKESFRVYSMPKRNSSDKNVGV